MAAALTEAKRQLLTIYTQSAYEAYLTENLRECEAQIRKIEGIQKGDINAVFLKGALIGRKAKPGLDLSPIRAALQIWKPLYEQLTGQEAEAIRAAIEETFSTILYIPLEQASRQWDTYCDARSAKLLADTVTSLLLLDDGFAAKGDHLYSQWIHQLFQKNYVFLVDEIIGMNKPIPVGSGVSCVKAYENALSETSRMAERIPDAGDSERAVRERARQKLEDLRRLNHLT